MQYLPRSAGCPSTSGACWGAQASPDGSFQGCSLLMTVCPLLASPSTGSLSRSMVCCWLLTAALLHMSARSMMARMLKWEALETCWQHGEPHVAFKQCVMGGKQHGKHQSTAYTGRLHKEASSSKSSAGLAVLIDFMVELSQPTSAEIQPTRLHIAVRSSCEWYSLFSHLLALPSGTALVYRSPFAVL